MDETSQQMRVPMRVNLQILETVASLLERNDVPSFRATAETPETGDSGRFLPVARAGDSFVDDPSQIELTYDATGCALTLPAGRQMQISFEGPVIDSGYLIYPMAPMNWNEMQVMVAQTVDLFEGAGWPVKEKPRFGPATQIRRSITEAELNKKTYATKTVTIGTWSPCDAPHIEARAEVRHLNSAPSDVSIPPTRPTGVRDPDAPDRFVMRVNFTIDQETLSTEITDLRDERRVAESGDADMPVPMARWVASPEWRPDGWAGEWIK